MNRENQYKSGKSKRNQNKRRSIIAILAVILTLIGSIRFSSVLSSAHDNLKEEPENFKYYKSIEIQSGDTLWGIAKDYMSDEYDSIQEYIDEVKQLNHLTSDNIQESKYLMIAYYDSEFK